ncbi:MULTISPECIES: phosphotransferase enzyme family protein [unclassified Vibrio]|uniref:phosphotransferase enzyme family protein n=1 Tax=unclassified Vibrio TaxID=2614977 RepID=UPI00159DED60|nr:MULTISPECIES: phosphotransferase [unclassified Vibrio]NVN83988.1 phosphotransferase [Vibrio sp. Scap16]QLE93877.1 phosphotransferase [Vibrio sp. Scap24]
MMNADILSHWIETKCHASLTEVTHGATNSVYKVGSKPAFFLRKYRTLDASRIKNEHELLFFLSQKVPTVVLPCLTSNGQSFVKAKGEYYALFPEAQGSLIEKHALTDTHAFEAGATLAKLHRQLSLYPRNGLPNEMFPVIQLSWHRELWLQRLDKIIAAIESKGEQNVEDEWALQRSIQQRSFLASSQSVHSYEPKTERVLIHGDFHHYNLFFDKCSKVSGIIDWDLVQYMPPAYEIARGCMYMFDMDVKKSVEFVGGYLSINELSKASITDGVCAWGVFADHHIWALEEVYLKQNLAARKFIPHKKFLPFEQQWSLIESHLVNKR